MGLKVIKTGDHSATLYNSELDEHYHSTHGAVQESIHVYIKMGLDLFKEKKNLRVFEMGLGTGLNVMLAWDFAHRNKVSIDFNSIEKFPLKEEAWSQMNYSQTVDQKDFFKWIHQSEWETKNEYDAQFSLTKSEIDLENYASAEGYDVVFYDAFGPRVQPELWELPIFQKLYSLMNENGVLVTYCAKGQVRRNMIEAGFAVERLAGPPGKREMLRATKK